MSTDQTHEQAQSPAPQAAVTPATSMAKFGDAIDYRTADEQTQAQIDGLIARLSFEKLADDITPLHEYGQDLFDRFGQAADEETPQENLISPQNYNLKEEEAEFEDLIAGPREFVEKVQAVFEEKKRSAALAAVKDFLNTDVKTIFSSRDKSVKALPGTVSKWAGIVDVANDYIFGFADLAWPLEKMELRMKERREELQLVSGSFTGSNEEDVVLAKDIDLHVAGLKEVIRRIEENVLQVAEQQDPETNPGAVVVAGQAEHVIVEVGNHLNSLRGLHSSVMHEDASQDMDVDMYDQASTQIDRFINDKIGAMRNLLGDVGVLARCVIAGHEHESGRRNEDVFEALFKERYDEEKGHYVSDSIRKTMWRIWDVSVQDKSRQEKLATELGEQDLRPAPKPVPKKLAKPGVSDPGPY